MASEGDTGVKSLGDGKYECAVCGATFAVGSSGNAPRTTIVATSGQAVGRVIEVDGKEIHRCLDRRPRGASRVLERREARD